MKLMNAALGVVLLAGLAQADDCCKHLSKPVAPCVKKECVFEPKTVPVKKPCYDVECVDICIPMPKAPWACCNDAPKCRVRTVKVPVLKSKDCGEKTEWKCKVYEVCDDYCHKGAKPACVVVDPMKK